MGQDEITRKLDSILAQDVNNECQVIYVLSRIRKILENNKQKNKFRFLNLYCNWVLHNKLDHKNTTVLLADLFGKDIDNKKGGRENARILISNHSDFFNLSSLRRELDGFLRDNHLSSEMLNRNWEQFSKLLLEIIKESPIIFESNILHQLELVKDGEGNYGYKFSIAGNKSKPIIKLKFR